MWPEFRRFGAAWSPWIEMRQLQQEMDRLFSGTSVPFAQDFPAFNLWVNEEKAIVTAEVPGIDAATMEITVKGDVLTISGNRAPDDLKEGETYHRQERGHGLFTRSIRIPFQVDHGTIDATYEKGILKIELPRAEADKPRKIQIKTQGGDRQ